MPSFINEVQVSIDGLHGAVLLLAKLGHAKEAQALIASVNVNPAADAQASHDEFNNRVSMVINWIESGKPTDRTFDSYFEMNDGDAVVAYLLLKAQANPDGVFAKNWTKYLTKDSSEAALKLYQSDFKGLDLATWAQHLRSRSELEWKNKISTQVVKDCLEKVKKISTDEASHRIDYEALYSCAMAASNGAGYVGLSAAETIEELDKRLTKLIEEQQTDGAAPIRPRQGS